MNSRTSTSFRMAAEAGTVANPRPRRVPRHRAHGSCVTAAIGLLLLTACDERGTYSGGAAGTPVLKHKNVCASQTVAIPGDTIDVSWAFKGEHLLSSQRARLLKLGSGGLEETVIALTKSQRSVSFPFCSAVTVILEATDTLGKSTDVAFDVLRDGQFHMHFKGVSNTWDRYPMVGHNRHWPDQSGAYGKSIDVLFAHAYAIYEMPLFDRQGQLVRDEYGQVIEDGVIDDIANDPLLRTLMPKENEFLGRSTSHEESRRFRYVLGSGFPSLPVEFTVDHQADLPPRATRCDVVITAAGIAYFGEPVAVKKEGNNVPLRRNNGDNPADGGYQVVWAQIDLRTNLDSDLLVADVHLANSRQGLSVSALRGYVAGDDFAIRGIDSAAATYELTSYGAVGTLTGSIKGATLGWGVQTKAGPMISDFDGVLVPGVYTRVDAIEWHVPLYPDDDLPTLGCN